MISKENHIILMEKYKIAIEDEAIATKALYDAMKSGENTESELNTLTQEMIDAHKKSMDIRDILKQKFLTFDFANQSVIDRHQVN